MRARRGIWVIFPKMVGGVAWHGFATHVFRYSGTSDGTPSESPEAKRSFVRFFQDEKIASLRAYRVEYPSTPRSTKAHGLQTHATNGVSSRTVI